MNYVYERDYAVLVRLKVPADATRHRADPRRGALARLHRQDLRSRAGRARARSAGRQRRRPTARSSTHGAGRLPRPLATLGAFRASPATSCASRSRCRRASTVDQPYLFPITDGVVDYDAQAELPPQRRPADRRAAAEGRGARAISPACSRSATGAGSSSTPCPAPVPARRHAGRRSWAGSAILWAVLGAIAGGILLNLMPCVFPILALKALHLSRAGGERARGAARRARLHGRGDRRHRRARRGAARDPRRGSARPAGRSSCRTRARSCCCCCSRSRSPRTCSACSSCRCSAAARSRRAASAPARSPRSSRRPAPGRSSAPRSGRRCCCRPAGSVAGVRRARAWAWRCRSWSSRFVPALRRQAAEARAVDGPAPALPRDPDGGERGRRAVAALPAGGTSGLCCSALRQHRLLLLAAVRRRAAAARRQRGALWALPAALSRWRRSAGRCSGPRRRRAARGIAGAEPWSEARGRAGACSRASRCSSISPPTGA